MLSAIRLRVLGLMGDEQHRHAPFGLHAGEQFQHVVAQRRPERGERLVEQQHRPVAHQDAGERDALALAARQFARQALLLAGKPGARQRLGDARAGPRRSAAAPASGRARHSSPTSRWANRLFSWNTIDTGRAAGGSAVTSAPPIRTRPDRGVSKPATRLSSVDLPEPLGPMTAVIDAGRDRRRRTASRSRHS